MRLVAHVMLIRRAARVVVHDVPEMNLSAGIPPTHGTALVRRMETGLDVPLDVFTARAAGPPEAILIEAATEVVHRLAADGPSTIPVSLGDEAIVLRFVLVAEQPILVTDQQHTAVLQKATPRTATGSSQGASQSWCCRRRCPYHLPPGGYGSPRSRADALPGQAPRDSPRRYPGSDLLANACSGEPARYRWCRWATARPQRTPA